jgi:hypothetical protein
MSVNPTREGRHFSKKTEFVRNLSASDKLHRVVQNPENHRNESQWRGLKRKMGRNAGELKLG